MKLSTGAALRFLEADQVRYQESANNNPREFQGGVIQTDSDGTNHIRLRVDTDGNTDVTFQVWISWRCLYTGSSVMPA